MFCCYINNNSSINTLQMKRRASKRKKEKKKRRQAFDHSEASASARRSSSLLSLLRSPNVRVASVSQERYSGVGKRCTSRMHERSSCVSAPDSRASDTDLHNSSSEATHTHKTKRERKKERQKEEEEDGEARENKEEKLLRFWTCATLHVNTCIQPLALLALIISYMDIAKRCCTFQPAGRTCSTSRPPGMNLCLATLASNNIPRH